MADGMRERMEARVQRLIDAGHSEDEILGMKDQLVSEVRGSLGPTPEPPATISSEPGNAFTKAHESPGLLDTLAGMGKLAISAPVEMYKNPAAAPRSLATGAASAATAGRAKDLHGPALDRMRAKAEAGPLDPGDMQTLSMWKDANNPGRERTPITDPKAALDELQGVHRQTQDETAAMPGTQFLGGMAIAPATLPGRVGGAGANALGKVVGPQASAVGRVLGASGGGAAGGGLGSIMADLMQGDTHGMLDRAKTAAETGAVLSGVPAAAGEAAQGLGRAVANSRGGQARQLLERNDVNVGLTTPGEGGAFGPGGQLEGRGPTDVDIGRTSRESAINIMRRQAQELSQQLQAPLAEKGALDARYNAPGPKPRSELVDVEPLVQTARDLASSEGLSDAQRGTVQGWVSRLEQHGQRQPDGSVTGPFLMPAGGDRGLNAFRGMLDRATGRGTDPGSPPAAEMQGVAGEAKSLVDETPYADVNQQIAGARGTYERGRSLLDLKKRPSGKATQAPEAGRGENIPEPDVAKVANMMSRQQQNTVTSGLRNADRLAAMGEEFPQHQGDIDAPRMLEARGDLSFKLRPDERGGLLGRMGKPAGIAGGAYMLADQLPQLGMDPRLAAMLGMGLTAGADVVRLNAPAIQGRVLYTPARTGAAAGRGASAVAPGFGATTAASLDPLQALLDQMEATKKKEKRK